MNKILKILFVSCIVCALFNYKQLYAQQNHFIYIQADDQQLFSVNINGKTYNSSEIGYVIIPKLTDGKYALNISFPNNKFPGQQFNCVVNKTDVGYALKYFGDKGWGLFNLQSLEITMAGSGDTISEVQKDTVKAEEQEDTVKTNAFGNMLSEVVDDTSLKVAPTNPPITETNKQSIPEKSVTASLDDSLKKVQNQTPATDTMTALNKSIMKIAEQTTDEGVDMVFVDPASGNDTIRIFLPSLQESQKKKEDSAIEKNKIVDSVAAMDTQSIREVKKNPSPDSSVSSQAQVNNPFFSRKQTLDTASKSALNNNPIHDKQTETAPSQMVYKQDCAKMLSDNDLDKLKKKMVAASSDDKMIQTARNYFQGKCVTTEQVKSLGALFLTDEARYVFFDAAYSYVYDISVFTSLESQLIDSYYKKRFRAMLK
jgi:hypothetical protein